MRSGPARTVLVSGGTRGIGLAVGVAFGRSGADVVLTHRWGSADAGRIAAAFEAVGAAHPRIVEADAADAGDLEALLDGFGPEGVDVFVPNVCVAGKGDGSLSVRTLARTLEYSAWPLLRYLDAMGDRFGRLPRHVVATSSDGPDRFYPGYDYVAAAKAVLEALCRDLAGRHPDVRVNALRARQVDTESYREMFPGASRASIDRFSLFDLVPEEVAAAAVCLAGGDLDGLSGETLVVDRGAGPVDNLVAVAPRLLGGEAAWEAFAPGADPAPPGVLWVDAGVAPAETGTGGAVRVVPLEEATRLGGEEVPAAVVVGCDWRGLSPAEGVLRATVLIGLMERAATAGRLPRYGVSLDLGAARTSAGAALGEVMSRYWGSWRVGTECRLNGVRFEDPALGPEALSAVRALLSGALDGMRGQCLNVTRRALK
jgi:NAD(P)-dependent dehydrogenase (short-subunit alcohol dehydrogenase family)